VDSTVVEIDSLAMMEFDHGFLFNPHGSTCELTSKLYIHVIYVIINSEQERMKNSNIQHYNNTNQ